MAAGIRLGCTKVGAELQLEVSALKGIDVGRAAHVARRHLIDQMGIVAAAWGMDWLVVSWAVCCGLPVVIRCADLHRSSANSFN
jgi:hypothetical protein